LQLTHWLRRRSTPILLTLGLLGGTAGIIATATPAAAVGTFCLNGFWYVHAPYSTDGGYSAWSWATCAPWSAFPPPPWDAFRGGISDIETIRLQLMSSQYGNVLAESVNYAGMGGQTNYPWSDTPIAARVISCTVWYRTAITGATGDTTYTPARRIC
jgi:hypothetical protein